MKRPKYNNHRFSFGGENFDSEKEFFHYRRLHLLLQSGEIKNLKRQVSYKFPINGENLRFVDSKREVKYIADYVYETQDGELVVSDAKGFRTRDYLLKKALMRSCHGIVIKEV